MKQQGDDNGVLIYNGKRYAVGLLWLLVNEYDAKSLGKHRVKKAKGDFYALRSSNVTQHGIGWLKNGHRSGMPAAAGIAVDRLIGEWHGVFKADNGWWYLQVHSDTIAPNGDQFFLSEEEAYNAFSENEARHNWPHSYAPKEWDKGTREVELSEIIDNSISPPTLQAVNLTAFFGSVKKMQMGVLAIFCVAAIAFAGMFLLQEDPIPVPKKTIPKKTATTTKPKIVKPVPILDVPEEEKIVELPKPSQLIDACGEAAAKIIKPIPGWALTTMVCDGKAVTVVWAQTVGSITTARAHVKSFSPDIRVAINGRNLSASMALSRLPMIQQENWLKTEQAIFSLEQRLNNIGRLQIKPVTPRPPPPPKKGEKPPKPPRPYIDITLSTTVSPKVLAGYFDLVGMEMKNITWDIKQQAWEYQAKLTTERKGG